MKYSRIVIILLLVSSFCLAQDTEEALLLKVKEAPASVATREKLAEFYLQDYSIDKCLEQWQAVLKLDPENAKAQKAVKKLSTWIADLDVLLNVMEELQANAVLGELGSLLKAVKNRAATDEQKARIAYIEAIYLRQEEEDEKALVLLNSIPSLYPNTKYAGKALIYNADMKSMTGKNAEAARIYSEVLKSKYPVSVTQRALLNLTVLGLKGKTRKESVIALENLQKSLTEPEIIREFNLTYADNIKEYNGKWTPESIDLVLASIKLQNNSRQTKGYINNLKDMISTIDNENHLRYLNDKLVQSLSDKPEYIFTIIESLFRVAIISEDFTVVETYLGQAETVLNNLKKAPLVVADPVVTHKSISRMFLIKAQKGTAIQPSIEAIKTIKKSEEAILALSKETAVSMTDGLYTIAGLYEHLKEWEMAVSLYRKVMVAQPTGDLAKRTLLKIATIYRRKLDAPLMALDVYSEYASRFPAEFLYRDKKLTRDLERVGYNDVTDFQKAQGLEPDGIFGPETNKNLKETLDLFDTIADDDSYSTPFELGKFIHPQIFQIAKDCQRKGRFREAIRAYHLFLNLFPTKREADDALIAIARIFRDNLLFEEAMGAYRELIYEFPKGNLTSEGYVEIAGCLENLGQWEEASKYYKEYKKKFPRYRHVSLCKNRIDQLDRIMQYDEFLKTTKNSPKLAEARYQIAAILYKEMGNHVKSAIEFRKVADLHPEHIRASEGLFMAGTALLHWQNFPQARENFKKLVESFPENRLADDGQYWIGHTYEYHARAVGKLDKRNIVLKNRSLKSQQEIIQDIELRKRYNPDAEAGLTVKKELWGDNLLGVLTSGSKRDAVNDELKKAIDAYRKTAGNFKMGDMADKALLRIAKIHTEYLNNQEKGIAVYQEILENFPGSKVAEDALYKVGEYQMEKQNYKEAVNLFKKFTHSFPKSTKAEDAMMSVARCFVETKEWASAIDAYQSYINKFRRGRHVSFAKAQIEWIRMYHF